MAGVDHEFADEPTKKEFGTEKRKAKAGRSIRNGMIESVALVIRGDN